MLQDIYNYLRITEKLSTGGQPTTQQFTEISQAGFEIVVNLALPSSDNALPDEQAIVEAQGIRYVSFQLSRKAPQTKTFVSFSRL